MWADQPGPGVHRLTGSLSAVGQALITVYASASGHVSIEVPFLLAQRAWNWPGHDFGGRPTGAVPPTRAAAIRVADELRAQGPDAVRGWRLTWRWERWDAPGLQPGQWVRVDPTPAGVRLRDLVAAGGQTQRDERSAR